jgi:peptidoglycan/xylan/chitin deacetylase (PgdA/CDA1 family)
MKKSPKHNLPILLYHRVVQSKKEVGKHKIYVFENQLKAELEYLKQNNFETITFEKLSQLPANADLQKKVILTFDDGYEDNYRLLFPLLKQYNFTAVIYLVTQLQRNEWGIKEGEPVCNLLTLNQIKEMQDYGIEFGGHTQHHIALNETTEQIAKNEIEFCQADVEKITGKKMLSFCYPFGGINQTVKKIMHQSNIPFAVATNTGAVNWATDKHQIRRLEIRPNEALGSFKNKVSGYYFTRRSIYTLFSKHIQ